MKRTASGISTNTHSTCWNTYRKRKASARVLKVTKYYWLSTSAQVCDCWATSNRAQCWAPDSSTDHRTLEVNLGNMSSLNPTPPQLVEVFKGLWLQWVSSTILTISFHLRCDLVLRWSITKFHTGIELNHPSRLAAVLPFCTYSDCNMFSVPLLGLTSSMAISDPRRFTSSL